MAQTEQRDVLFKLRIDATQSEAEIKKMTDATEKQEQAIKKSTEAIKAEVDSITALRQKNKELTAERNNTSTATEAGRAKIKALNDELDKNNAKIKDNVDAYTKQKIGIGDYSGALDKLVPGLGATTQGIKGMTASSLTFIATPIGAVIGAIGLALGALIRYFKGSEEGQNNLNKVSKIFTIILGNIDDVVQSVGKAIFDAFSKPQESLEKLGTMIKQFILDRFNAILEVGGLLAKSFKQLFAGEFSEAFKTAGEAGKKFIMDVSPIGLIIEGATKAYEGLNAIIKETNDEIKKGLALENLKAQTDLLERQLIVQRQVLNAKIAENKLRSEDKSLDIEERIKALQEATEAQNKLSQMETTVAQNRFKIKQTENSFSNSTKEDLREEAELEAQLFAIQKDNADKRKEMFTKEQALRDEITNKEKERLKAEREEQARIEAEQAENNRKVVEENAKKAAEKQLEIEKIKTAGITNLIRKVTGERIDAQKLYTTIFKKGALSEAYTNTKAAAIAAYKSLAGIPIVGPALGVLAAGAATLYGIQQATGIAAIGFARGGRVLSGQKITSGMGTPIRRSNGDNMLATVKTGEVILNERQQAALGGSRTFARIGVPGFATGGVVERESTIAANNLRQEQALVDIANAVINQPQKVLVREEFELKQNEADDIRRRSVIIE